MGCPRRHGAAHAALRNAHPRTRRCSPGRRPAITTDPPILIVEVASPDDEYTALNAKVREFLTSGVNTAWIINAETELGELWTSPDACVSSPILSVAGTEIHLSVPELFEALKQS